MSWKVEVPEGRAGAVEVRKFEVSEMTAMMSILRDGYRSCPAGEYTGLYRNGGLWMSDTPAEARDHYAPVWEAKKRPNARVLVVGLGLGMVVKQLLLLDNVRSVDVVEIDPDVNQLVGPTYWEDERVRIYEADIFQKKWPVGTRWDVAWFDIWQNLSADNLPEMTTLARSYGRRADWKGYWGKDEIQAHERRYASGWW